MQEYLFLLKLLSNWINVKRENKMTNKPSTVNLEDFISEVLTQIINGVKKAQAHAKENGARINSNTFIRTSQGDIITGGDRNGLIQEIDFDIAVTVSSQGGLQGGIGIPVLGYVAKKEDENSTVSRIKFKLPVTLPRQER
jgi:hypothetical protein